MVLKGFGYIFDNIMILILSDCVLYFVDMINFD